MSFPVPHRLCLLLRLPPGLNLLPFTAELNYYRTLFIYYRTLFTYHRTLFTVFLPLFTVFTSVLRFTCFTLFLFYVLHVLSPLTELNRTSTELLPCTYPIYTPCTPSVYTLGTPNSRWLHGYTAAWRTEKDAAAMDLGFGS